MKEKSIIPFFSPARTKFLFSVFLLKKHTRSLWLSITHSANQDSYAITSYWWLSITILLKLIEKLSKLHLIYNLYKLYLLI